MPKSSNLRLSVDNLGPVRSGKVELKPLTILIGPNNAGKSYLAHVAYALWKALSGNLRRPVSAAPSFDDYLDQQLRAAPDRVPFDQLPRERQEILHTQLDRYSLSLTSDLDESIRRYFGCLDSRELIRGGTSRRSLTIEVNPKDGDGGFLVAEVDGDGLSTSLGPVGTGFVDVPLSADPTLSPMSDDSYTLGLVARHLWSQVLAANGFAERSIYYLPAARSGIITSLEAYTTAAIDRVWRSAGSEPIAIAPFPGVAADFLQIMVALRFGRDPAPEAYEPMQPAIDVLEQRILRGRISARLDGTYRLGMVYEADGLQMPIHRTSAMVAELAPLDLWLKDLLRPGDWLIIDEPEAHLHPENQRLIARVLVRLVRAGVRVVCPTHSSTILHQVSNHILAARLDSQEREAVEFTDDDFVRPDEVGVYLFQPKRDGTHVEPVQIEPDWGISEDEFLRVGEAIGEETYKLSVAAMDGDLVHAER